MTLPYREARLLRRVDHALRRSDPDLASLLSIFARLSAAEAMPDRERLRPQPSWAWRVLLWPVAVVALLVAALAFLVVFAAGGGRTAAMACAAAPVRRVSELRATLATPTVMARADERISGRGSSRNGPFGGRILKAFLSNGPWFHGPHPCASEPRPGRGRDDDAAAGYSPPFSVVFRREPGNEPLDPGRVLLLRGRRVHGERGLGAAGRLVAPVTYVERRGRVWGRIAEQAAARGGRVSAADVCAAVVPEVQVTGAWLSAGLDAQAGHLMQVTDEVGKQLADLQLTLGEGPLLDASASSGPVLASDLADGEWGARWPAFGPAASKAGAAAVFVFPLVVGAIRAGVLGLYRDRPGPLSDFQLGDALVFADTATLLLLDGHDLPRDPGSYRAAIDQATGMLTEQLDVSITDAFVRLRAYAYVNDIQLAAVARDIVARRLRLVPDPDLPLGDKT
jgi:hypothetical protein